MGNLPDYVSDFFKEYRRPIVTIGLIFAAFISVKLVLALLGAINEIPLLAPTFELTRADLQRLVPLSLFAKKPQIGKNFFRTSTLSKIRFWAKTLRTGPAWSMPLGTFAL